MPKYDKPTAVGLAERLAALAQTIVRNLRDTPDTSAELIDHHCETIASVLLLLETPPR